MKTKTKKTQIQFNPETLVARVENFALSEDEQEALDDQKITTSIGGKRIKVSEMWDIYRDSIGVNGLDVAAYVSSGMSWWPCGRTFQQGGRDGFKADVGTGWCQCDTCNEVRRLLPPDDDDDPIERFLGNL